jgi:hypothetical protein
VVQATLKTVIRKGENNMPRSTHKRKTHRAKKLRGGKARK